MQETDNSNPTILAVGGSWFWYPLTGGSLLNNLGDMTRTLEQAIYAPGINGAEAYDYMDGRYSKQVREAPRQYGSGVQAVFSGGHNDFAGFNNLRPLPKADCSGATLGGD